MSSSSSTTRITSGRLARPTLARSAPRPGRAVPREAPAAGARPRPGRRRRRPRCRRRTRPRRPRPPARWCPRRCRRRPRCAAPGGRRRRAGGRARTLSSSSRHELLAAEAGLDRHDQQRVEVRQQLQVRLDRGVPVDRQPGLGAGRAQVLGQRHRVVARLGVERHVVRARPRRTRAPTAPGPSIIRCSRTAASVAARRLCTTGSPMVRFGTKWLSMTSTCSQSAAPSTARDLVGEAGEVGGEDAGRDDRRRYGHRASVRTRPTAGCSAPPRGTPGDPTVTSSVQNCAVRGGETGRRAIRDWPNDGNMARLHQGR